MIRRKLFAAVGVITIVLSLVYISWPVGHIPPYDANLVRLAESDLQGYCTGKAFMITGGAGDANAANIARSCRAGVQRSNKPNLMVVQQSFCQGIVAVGWQGTVSDCLSIMAANEYWPTYDGNITNAWNRARPYPRPIVGGNIGSQGSQSRTGGHQSNSHQSAPGRGWP